MKKLSLLILAGAFLFGAMAIATAEDAKEVSTQRAVFKVENMTCGACYSNINAGLSPLEGFSGMGVNLFRKLVAVDFIGSLSAEEIGAAITKSGYPATLESVDPIMKKESFAYLNTRKRGPGGGGSCCSGGTNPPVASQDQSLSPQSELPIGAGGSCCTLPGGSLPGAAQLPPATIN